MHRSVYIETYGCAFNAADSETLEGLLRSAGWEIASSAECAGVVVLNSCTVKDRTYLDFQKRLASLREGGGEQGAPAVVVAGCIPKANPRDPILRDVASIGPHDLMSVVRAAESAAQQKPFREMGGLDSDRLNLPRRRKNPAVEILPINQGCLSACSFCQTRLARGRLVSYPVRDLLRRASLAVQEGVREIWLTSQDTGAYGADIGSSLAQLLGELSSIEGEYRIRVGMSSPQWFYRDLEALLEAFDHPRVYQFLHLPVQSGDDETLREMRRENTVAQFEEVCQAFRRRFERIALWTDIIVGYPGETEEAFERTLELVRRVEPATVNRSRYSRRPGTAAARLQPLPSSVVADRSKRLSRLVEEISEAGLSQWIGWEGQAWVSEVKRPGSAVARNFAYRPIVLKGDFERGQALGVRIGGQTAYHLRGVAISHPAAETGAASLAAV